jgi:hypothetical protein
MCLLLFLKFDIFLSCYTMCAQKAGIRCSIRYNNTEYLHIWKLPTPWSRVLEKQIVLQIARKFLEFNGT